MKNQKRRLHTICLAVAALLVMSMALTACGGGSNNAETTAAAAETTAAAEETTTAAETTTAEETTTAAPEYDTIGTKSADSVEFLLTNKTGKAIKAFSVESEAIEGPIENMMKADEVFANGETRQIFIDVKKDAAQEETTAAAEDAAEAAPADDATKALTPEYLIHLVLEDDSELTLHAFPVSDIKAGDVCVEGTVGYLVYESLSGQKNISTLTAEQALVETAAPDTAVDAAAPEQPVYEEPVAPEEYVEAPVEEYYEEQPVDNGEVPVEGGQEGGEVPVEGGQEGGEGGEGEDDACIEDGLFY